MNVTRAISFDDWVWVKDTAFTMSPDDSKLTFLVEWNDVDFMFAITSRCGSRVARDMTDNSKTGAFSINAIHCIHHTLEGLHSGVPKLPARLPKEPSGLKAIFVGIKMPQDKTALCQDLEKYFCMVAEKVGSQILHEVMFEAAAGTTDNYYEKMSEVHRKDLSQRISYIEDELKNIAFERANCVVMRDLEDVYRREDEAVLKLVSALADFYNYELQPYLDSQALAKSKIQHLSQLINSPNMGERVKNESREQHLYWGCLLVESQDVSHKLYIEHQAELVSWYQELLKLMKTDKNRFGATAFDLVAAGRELLLYQELYTAKVKLLQNKRKQLKHNKDKINMQIPEDKKLQESSQVKSLIGELNLLQEKIYSIELDILTEKTRLLNIRVDIRRREISDAEECFHDALEDVDQLSDDEGTSDGTASDVELMKLKQEKIKVFQHQARIRAKRVWA